MVMNFTTYLSLNWALVGFCFGIGYFVASAIYNGLVWLLARGRTPPVV